MSERVIRAAVVCGLAVVVGWPGLPGRERSAGAQEVGRRPAPSSNQPPPPPRPADQPATSTRDLSPRSTRDPDEKPATDPKPDADRALRGKGLRRDGLVYVLDAEDDVARAQASLELAANEMQVMTARMNQLVSQAGQVELFLVGAQRELENAYAAAQFASNQVALEIQLANAAANASTSSGTTTGKTGTSTGSGTGTGTGTTPTTTPSTTTGTTTLTPARQIALIQEAQMRQQRIAYLEGQVYQLQSQRLQASMEFDRLNTGLLFKQAELDRGGLALAALADQIAKRYDDLAHDPDVKTALSRLNVGVKKPYALGPRKDYKANVRKMAAELLESRRFVVEKGGKVIQLQAGKQEATLAYLARRFVDDLRKTQQRQADNTRGRRSHEVRIASLAARETDLTARLARANGAHRSTIDTELATVRKDLHRYRKDLAASDDARKALARDLAEKREGFVQVVDALKKASELKATDEDATREDSEVQAAIQKFKPGRKPARANASATAGGPKTTPPGELYGRALRRIEVPLQPDRVALWVTATVNDQAGRRLVVDPTIDTVRISSRFAREIRADVPADGPTVSVTLSDGRAVRARRTTLRSVAIGTLVANDVEALVLLDGFDGPPRLGGSFFDRFVTHIEPESARLTLTQVDLRALPATPAARSNARPVGR